MNPVYPGKLSHQYIWLRCSLVWPLEIHRNRWQGPNKHLCPLCIVWKCIEGKLSECFMVNEYKYINKLWDILNNKYNIAGVQIWSDRWSDIWTKTWVLCIGVEEKNWFSYTTEPYSTFCQLNTKTHTQHHVCTNFV